LQTAYIKMISITITIIIIISHIDCFDYSQSSSA